MWTEKLPGVSEPLSGKGLISAVGVEAAARGLAVRGLPLAGETDLSKTESEIREIVEGRIRARHGELSDMALAMRGELAAIGEAGRSVARLPSVVTGRIMSTFQTLGGVIRTTVAAERQARAEFNAYREKHGLLERSAEYPVSKIKHFAIVVLTGLCESAANAAMYLDASSAGWFGAVLAAVAVASGNIGVAVLAGLTWRYIKPGHDGQQSDERPRGRWWAIPGVVTCIVIIVGLNFFAAHYRQVGATSEDFSETQVIEHLRDAPFELSLSAVLLFVVGLLCAIFAAYKGYTSTDKYPGYERADRRYINRSDAKEDLRVSIQGQLDAIQVAEVDGMLNRILADRAMIEEIRKRFTTFQIASERTAKLDAGDIAAGEAAISWFRQLNKKVRTDGATPVYFNQAIDFRAAIPQARHDDIGTIIDDVALNYDEASRRWSAEASKERERIEVAKENTERIMLAIEREVIADSEVPRLMQVRGLIGGDHGQGAPHIELEKVVS